MDKTVIDSALDVAIREIDVDDVPELERFYEALDPETRCLRFCAASRGLSHTQSAYFCRHDGTRHEGLVATRRIDGAERIVGHLCIEPERADAAEVALVVAESVQHHGVGRRLVEAGVRWARGAGFRTLTATMLIGNEPIWRLLTSLGLPYRTEIQGAGTCRLEIDLSVAADNVAPADRLVA